MALTYTDRMAGLGDFAAPCQPLHPLRISMLLQEQDVAVRYRMPALLDLVRRSRAPSPELQQVGPADDPAAARPRLPAVRTP